LEQALRAILDGQVLRDLLDRRVYLDHLQESEIKASKVSRVQVEFKEMLVPQDQQERAEQMEYQAQTAGILATLDLEVFRDGKEFLVRGLRVSKVYLERMELSERMVFKDFKDSLVLLEVDSRESKELLAFRELLVPLDLDIKAFRATRVSREPLVFRAFRAFKGFKASRVFRAFKGFRAFRA
jgi:predicted RNA-binding protein